MSRSSAHFWLIIKYLYVVSSVRLIWTRATNVDGDTHKINYIELQQNVYYLVNCSQNCVWWVSLFSGLSVNYGYAHTRRRVCLRVRILCVCTLGLSVTHFTRTRRMCTYTLAKVCLCLMLGSHTKIHLRDARDRKTR